jgi:SAM-dependent methyltransferase
LSGVEERPDDGVVLGDSVLQSITLESLRSVVNYHDWLTSLALPYLGEHPIELGSGLGDYARRWVDAGVPEVTATELDPARASYLEQHVAQDPRIHVKRMDVLQPVGSGHSALVAFNVLEHIERDVDALRGAHRLVRPGGAVVMFVPAFQFALGKFDREVGHVRRYTVASLRRTYEDAGLSVERIEYVNLPGLLSWFVAVRLLRMTPADGAMVRVWDRMITPRARRWEQNHRVPFGQSVFCVGRVPES